MESALQNPPVVATAIPLSRFKGAFIGFWVVTALFGLQMTFTAYAQLRLPQVADVFTHLGFPGYFRVELLLAKLLGVLLLVTPVPARVKEWAYAGFAINLASALIAHISVGDSPAAWGWAAVTGVLWALSYIFWRRLQRGRYAGGPPATATCIGSKATTEPSCGSELYARSVPMSSASGVSARRRRAGRSMGRPNDSTGPGAPAQPTRNASSAAS